MNQQDDVRAGAVCLVINTLVIDSNLLSTTHLDVCINRVSCGVLTYAGEVLSYSSIERLRNTSESCHLWLESIGPTQTLSCGGGSSKDHSAFTLRV